MAAVLLMLSNYILENGHVVEKTSTSLPCSWNKGKKRNKTPRKLHESMYESSKQKHPGDLYHWDPRPSEYRRQFSENLEQHTSLMIFITQTNTGTMVKRVPQEQMFVIEATLYL